MSWYQGRRSRGGGASRASSRSPRDRRRSSAAPRSRAAGRARRSASCRRAPSRIPPPAARAPPSAVDAGSSAALSKTPGARRKAARSAASTRRPAERRGAVGVLEGHALARERRQVRGARRRRGRRREASRRPAGRPSGAGRWAAGRRCRSRRCGLEGGRVGEQALRVLVGRRVEDLVDPPQLDDPPQAHHRHAPRDRPHEREVVRDEEHGGRGRAGAPRAARRSRPARTRRALTSPRRRRARRPADQRPGDRDALALAAGELVGIPVGVPALSATRSSISSTCASGLSTPPKRSSGWRTICPTVRRGLSEPYGFWKMYWMSRRASRGRPRELAASGRAAQEDLARPLRVKARDRAGERGLARPRLADERQALARRHLEVHVVDNRQVAVRRRGRREREHRLAGVRGGEVVGARRDGGGLDAHLLRAHAAHLVAVADIRRSGSACSHAGWTKSQRGAKKQPGGRLPGEGARPGMPTSARRPEMCGIAATSRRVYGWAARAEELLALTQLDDPARVHDGDAGRERADDCEVVADVERRRAVQGRELPHGPQHVGLGRHVEAGRRLVEHDHPRAGRRTPSPGRCAAAGRRRARAGSAAGTPARRAAPPRASSRRSGRAARPGPSRSCGPRAPP